MRHMADRRKPRTLVALAVLGVILTACGDDPTPTAVGNQQTTTGNVTSTLPATIQSTTTSSLIASATTAATRSPIPTTALPSVADAKIGKSLIPEATASYEVEPTTIDGVQYANSLRINAQRTPAKVEINAGRSRQKLLGTLGIPDDQKSSTSVQVEISLDNAPAVFSAVVNFGETKKIDLDVTNALRVKITVLVKSGDQYTNVVAIGDPRFA